MGQNTVSAPRSSLSQRALLAAEILEKGAAPEIGKAMRELALVNTQLVDALENGLRNEGQDGCYLGRYGFTVCKCWRCQARRAITAAKAAA